MAINFSKLKDPKLGLLDKLTFGKLKDCRLCDVIQDHYRYLTWIKEEGYVKYQQEVLDLIEENTRLANVVVEADTKKQLQIFHGKYDWATKEYEFDQDNWIDDIPF